MKIRLPLALFAIGIIFSVVRRAVTGEWDFFSLVGFGILVGGPVAAIITLALACIPTAFHELGHLVAARFAGYAVYGVDVGPFRMRRVGNRWRFRLESNVFSDHGLAYVAAVTPDDLLSRYRAILIAGPLASLILCLLCVAAAFLVGGPTGWPYSTGGWFLVLGAMSGLHLIVSLNPNGKVGGIDSDRAQILGLRRNPEESEYMIRFYAVYLPWSIGGMRARDWPMHMLALEEPIPDPWVAGVYYFRYYHHLDRGELAEALEDIEKVARAPNEPEFRNTMLLELAYARARIGRDIDGARQAFGEFRAARDTELLAHRAQAAIARLSGDDATAQAHLEAARSLLDKEADLDSTRAEREFLEAIREIEPL